MLDNHAGALVLGVTLAVLLAPSAAALAGEVKPVEAVPSVDLDRYAGRWYEIARLPNRFQNDCACCVTATYTPRDDGRLTVVNECRETDGKTKGVTGEAKLADEDGSASKLKVRFAPAFLAFLGFVWGDYWVLDLDEDYTRALVGAPNRKYLWVLSRTPTMTDEGYEALMDTARAMGFEVDRVEKTPQEE